MSDESNQVLSAEQVRVLACLMEKHLSTPNNYLEEGKVVNTAQQLKELGLLSIEYGERINKYSHRAPGKFGVTREQQAVLGILMLREPLTLNEIKARTEKMIGFESINRVQEVVNELISNEPALVMQLPVAAGQREERFTHLLAGEPDLSAIPVKEPKKSNSSQSQKVDELESRIARLEAALDMIWPDNQE